MGGYSARWTFHESAPLCGSREVMINEQKLENALAKIARWKAGHPHGKPMSGLSIPAKYYFGGKKGREAVPRHHARRAHAPSTGK